MKRGDAGIVGLIAFMAMMILYRFGLMFLEHQAEESARQQFAAAASAFAWREEVRLANVSHFAHQLSTHAAVKAWLENDTPDGVTDALKTTSFGPGGVNAMLVGKTGSRAFFGGKGVGGPGTAPVIDQALKGLPSLAVLQPDDPLVARFTGQAPPEPYVVAAAPLRIGDEVAGVVVTAEPMSPDFFQHFLGLTGVLLAVEGNAATYGPAPGELVKDASATAKLLRTGKGNFIAQKLELRAAPNFALGSVVAAVGATELESRRDKLFYIYIGGLGVIVLTLFVLGRKRA